MVVDNKSLFLKTLHVQECSVLNFCVAQLFLGPLFRQRCVTVALRTLSGTGSTT
jgi:hypothetical protein